MFGTKMIANFVRQLRCEHRSLDFVSRSHGNMYGAVGEDTKTYRCRDCGKEIFVMVPSLSWNHGNYHLFLGGNDLEMMEIKKFFIINRLPFSDAKLAWGAKASAYQAEIIEVVSRGYIPVLIELTVDIQLPEGAVVIDHHGERSGQPASILQVLNLFKEEATRQQQLVAAEDSGSYFGLVEFSATPEEIEAIMRESRVVQGFTPEMEEASAQAVEEADYSHRNFVIVHMPFSKFAAAKSLLWLKGYNNIFFWADDGEIEFQGDGKVCQLLKEYFPENSWCGGAGLGLWGRYDAFWGGYHPGFDVVRFLSEQFD